MPALPLRYAGIPNKKPHKRRSEWGSITRKCKFPMTSKRYTKTNDRSNFSDRLRVDVRQMPDGRLLAIAEGHELVFERMDQDTLVRDVDLAAFLGFDRPENIRNLIKRMVSTGKLSRDAVFFTVKKTPGGGRPSTEFWLTRTQALLVTTQSDTPRAWTMTTRIVHVFEAVVFEGKRVDDSGIAAAVLKLSEVVAEGQRTLSAIAVRLERVEARLDGDHTTSARHSRGLLGDVGARAVLREIQSIAGIYHPRKTREWRSRRRSIDLAVRETAGLTSRRWADMDISLQGRAWQKLGELRARALAEVAERERVRQGVLFGFPGGMPTS